jgi:hypothetical protein
MKKIILGLIISIFAVVSLFAATEKKQEKAPAEPAKKEMKKEETKKKEMKKEEKKEEVKK